MDNPDNIRMTTAYMTTIAKDLINRTLSTKNYLFVIILLKIFLNTKMSCYKYMKTHKHEPTRNIEQYS